jgi:diadenosine tetraphosphate (Ap4A) HIT family hydrolase
MSQNCPLCEAVMACHNNTNPLLIHEFEHSILVFGQHQFYPGYCLLVAKQHARELHRLLPEVRDSIWQELMRAGRAIDEVFKPWKLNYASYGNQVEHIHWHIFPRYEIEPTKLNCPFSNAEQFGHFPSDIEDLAEYVKLLNISLM